MFKNVVAAAKLAGKSNNFKLSQEEAQRALLMQEDLTKPVIKKFKLPADQAAQVSGSKEA